MLTTSSSGSWLVRDRFFGAGDFDWSRRLLLPSETDDDDAQPALVDTLRAA